MKTHSPADAVSVSTSQGSLRMAVTAAPVCLGLISVDIFQDVASLAMAPRILTPLLTRALN